MELVRWDEMVWGIPSGDVPETGCGVTQRLSYRDVRFHMVSFKYVGFIFW